jgi:hypothetical protein
MTENELAYFIIVIAMLIIIGCAFGFVLSKAFGENYVYHLTKNESDQVIISELCYSGVDIGECAMLYGSLRNNYGEALR